MRLQGRSNFQEIGGTRKLFCVFFCHFSSGKVILTEPKIPSIFSLASGTKHLSKEVGCDRPVLLSVIFFLGFVYRSGRGKINYPNDPYCLPPLPSGSVIGLSIHFYAHSSVVRGCLLASSHNTDFIINILIRITHHIKSNTVTGKIQKSESFLLWNGGPYE